MADAGRVVVVAIVGAESTGKTTLAQALCEALRSPGGPGGRRVAWVPEVLRGWCERNGRTPLAHEQASILRMQHEQVAAAIASHDTVVCDTTALMTAVYSRLVFGDTTLEDRAGELHRRHVGLTLLTALDLPWVADGFQRSSPQVQRAVDQELRALMRRQHIGFSVVSGQGGERLGQALAAVAADAAAPARAGGLFSRLAGHQQGPGTQHWLCECCPEPAALRKA